jgi:tryptophan-rich sensory protein
MAFATLGGLLTDLGPWYHSLKQPDWKPPDAAFGAIWSTIFALCAGAGWLSWNYAPSRSRKYKILILYLVNGALNVLWSVLYFQLHRPDWSMIELIFLWLSVLSLIVAQWRESKWASVMVVPYLVWVSAAGFLNWDGMVLNGPFA